MKPSIDISIVSPVYRAEPIVDKLVDRIATELKKITKNFEIILVEDRGPDRSWERIQENCRKHDYVKGIRLSKNCGQQYAIQCGLDASRGNVVITMDCDLQDDPKEIIKLVEKSKEGFDIVVASRQQRQDSIIKKTLSKSFYGVLGYLTETEQDSSVANFVLLRRNVVDALSNMNDKNRYYPMMIQWVGFKKAKVEIKHAAREDGRSSYSLSKRLKLAFDTILTFSDKPLRLSVLAGVSISIVSIIVAFVMVWMHFGGNVAVAGWTSLAVLNSFFSGVIISVLGMVGLYVGKTFESVKSRPTYIIDTTENL